MIPYAIAMGNIKAKTKIGERRSFTMTFGLNRKRHGEHFLGDHTHGRSKLRLSTRINVLGSELELSKVIIE